MHDTMQKTIKSMRDSICLFSNLFSFIKMSKISNFKGTFVNIKTRQNTDDREAAIINRETNAIISMIISMTG